MRRADPGQAVMPVQFVLIELCLYGMRPDGDPPIYNPCWYQLLRFALKRNDTGCCQLTSFVMTREKLTRVSSDSRVSPLCLQFNEKR